MENTAFFHPVRTFVLYCYGCLCLCILAVSCFTVPGAVWHLAVVQSYISRDDRDGLREYIEIYKTELPPDITEVYCRNQVINALVCYYAALARKDRIQFDAQVSYPDNCPVSDTGDPG